LHRPTTSARQHSKVILDEIHLFSSISLYLLQKKVLKVKGFILLCPDLLPHTQESDDSANEKRAKMWQTVTSITKY
jgi:hypothetical protein